MKWILHRENGILSRENSNVFLDILEINVIKDDVLMIAQGIDH
jgi:hypothetical protein